MTIVYVEEIPCLKVSFANNKVNKEIYNSAVPHFSKEFRHHDGNVVCVSCFPPFPGNSECEMEIKNYIRSKIKSKDTRIVFDNLYEGHVTSCLVGIHKIIEELKLDPAQCYFVTAGLQTRLIYDFFCREHNIKEPVNVRIFNLWERHAAKALNEIPEPTYNIKNKDKLFLSFNRICREHRVSLLGLMYDRNLVDKSYYSFFPDSYGYPAIRIVEDLNRYISEETQSIIKKHISQHNEEFPLMLNSLGANDNVNYVKPDDNLMYDNSYFSLVTETFFYKKEYTKENCFDETSVFFSEKVFKPVLCKHPFIMLNRPHALKYFRSLGYKTFSPYIDESFDSMENDEERLLAIVAEVERLSKQTPDEWIEWQKGIKDIVEYNYSIISSKTHSDHEFEGS